MATHSTANAQVEAVLNTWLNKKFVDDLMFELQHQKFTADAMIPEGGGSAARYIEWAPPTRNTAYSAGNTQLAEGTTTAHEITGITQQATTVTVTEFGEWVRVTSLFEFASMPGTRQQTIKRLRDGAAMGLDDAVRVEAHTTTLAWGANILESGAAVSVTATVPQAAPARLSASALMTIRGGLRDGLVQGIEGKAGHPNREYAAVLTPAQETQITTEVTTGRLYWSSAVINVPGTEGQLKFVRGYIGSIYGTAVYITQNYVTATFTTTANHHVGYMYGADAVAAVAFRQMKPQVIINDVNSPYKNVNSIAWWAMFGARRIVTLTAGAQRVVKIYSTA